MTIDAIHDPTAPEPICDRAEFDELVAEMVADGAPRLFAVVQEHGERIDAWIAAWGMAFSDHAEIVSDSGRMSLSCPERALWIFGLRPDLTPHLVWLTPPPPVSEDGGIS